MYAIHRNIFEQMKYLKITRNSIKHSSVKNKNYVIYGSPTGIGFNIAKKLALNGAKITFISKDVYSFFNVFYAAEKINTIAKKNICQGVTCNVSSESEIKDALKEAEDEYGNIHGVVVGTEDFYPKNTFKNYEKEINDFSNIKVDKHYLFGKTCLKKMNDQTMKGHMIIISPPLEIINKEDYWKSHYFYTLSKINKTLMTKSLGIKFKNIAVNSLWPSHINSLISQKYSEEINYDKLGEAALILFEKNPEYCHGNHFLDKDLITS